MTKDLKDFPPRTTGKPSPTTSPLAVLSILVGVKRNSEIGSRVGLLPCVGLGFVTWLADRIVADVNTSFQSAMKISNRLFDIAHPAGL